jgi:hypothetical protein
MGSNTGTVSRKGAAKKRTRTINPKTGLYVKRDAATGKFISAKDYKGVTADEMAKMSPVLKKLADYDKKGKQ